jgi:ribonucleoside-diphosphate reductase alpha chain
MIQALLGRLCKMANVSLQHGVPLRVIVDCWIDSNFDPSGLVGGHPYIKTCRSVINLAARLLAYHELGNTSVLNIQPNEKADPMPALTGPAAGQQNNGYKLTGESCPECGAHMMMPTGAGCKKCLRCGHSGACG